MMRFLKNSEVYMKIVFTRILAAIFLFVSSVSFLGWLWSATVRAFLADCSRFSLHVCLGDSYARLFVLKHFGRVGYALSGLLWNTTNAKIYPSGFIELLIVPETIFPDWVVGLIQCVVLGLAVYYFRVAFERR